MALLVLTLQGYSDDLPKKAEPLAFQNLEFRFTVENFEGNWFSNLEVQNTSDEPIVDFYKHLPRVALGIDGNRKVAWANGDLNRLRIFSWGPLKRNQRNLAPYEKTGLGVRILFDGQQKTTNDSVIDGFVAQYGVRHRFEFYIEKGDEFHLVRRLYVKFDRKDIGSKSTGKP